MGKFTPPGRYRGDIDVRRSLQANQRHTRRWAAEVLRNGPEGIAITDGPGSIVDGWEKGWLRISGDPEAATPTGISIDPNEIAMQGAHLNIETLDNFDIKFKRNGNSILEIRDGSVWTNDAIELESPDGDKYRITTNVANLLLRDSASLSRIIIEDGGHHHIQVPSGKAIFASDTDTGYQEIFPKGTLITMGNANSTADVPNRPNVASEVAASVQTIACDYPNQELYVEITAHVTWKNLVHNKTVWSRPSINGGSSGMQPARDRFNDTGSAGPAVTSGTTGSASSGSTDNDTHDHDYGTSSWTTNGPSTGTIHTHTAPNNTLDGPNDTHLHNISNTHVHGSGNLDTAPHTHTAQPFQMTQTTTVRTATSADANGNVKVGIETLAQGGTEDIDVWSISWAIWRR